MNRTIRKTILALSLALVMVFSAFLQFIPVSAFAVSTEEIEALKRERDAINAERAEKQAVVDKLEDEQAGILERKNALDERNELSRRQIELNEQQIKLYDAMIAEEAAKVDAALALENEQLERYRSRVRAMEENGSYNILSLILKADNLAELLTSIDDISEIMESDRELEDEYIEAREQREEIKAKYEEFKAEFEGKEDALRAEQDMLQKELEEAAKLLEEISNDLEHHAAELAELEAAQQEAEDNINSLIAELEAERRAAAAAAAEEARASGGGSSGGTVGTGSFIWPCPSCYYITSRQGPRTHPITGVYKNHAGTDIGAQYGATVIAADSGTVSLAGENGGYGNCVMINHGNGYYTLYGHLSSIAVSEGQSVSQGDIVGYVGSTGNSTGPHLHFEIRSGDEKLNPENFFSGGFSYAPDA